MGAGVQAVAVQAELLEAADATRGADVAAADTQTELLAYTDAAVGAGVMAESTAVGAGVNCGNVDSYRLLLAITSPGQPEHEYAVRKLGGRTRTEAENPTSTSIRRRQW